VFTWLASYVVIQLIFISRADVCTHCAQKPHVRSGSYGRGLNLVWGMTVCALCLLNPQGLERRSGSNNEKRSKLLCGFVRVRACVRERDCLITASDITFRPTTANEDPER
jgi:hypothetical protein